MLKRIICLTLLAATFMSFLPIGSNYAAAEYKENLQSDSRTGSTGRNEAKNTAKSSVTINGVDYFIVTIPAPEINDPMEVQVPEANDPMAIPMDRFRDIPVPADSSNE